MALGAVIWNRTSNQMLLKIKIVQFPHDSFEIKLELSGERIALRTWTCESQNSGSLLEADEFSKFDHGHTVLFLDYARCAPHKIIDSSTRDSITPYGACKTLDNVILQLEEEQDSSKS